MEGDRVEYSYQARSQGGRVGGCDPFARDANKIKLKSYRRKKRKREIRKCRRKSRRKSRHCIGKIQREKSFQDVNFLAIWGFQMQGNVGA